MENGQVIGYKGFNQDLRCRNFQYEIGKTYSTEKIDLCKVGFHFCRNLYDVFYHYSDDGYNKFCLVLCEDKIIDDNEQKKSVTNKITILRELTREEIFREINQDKLDYLFNIQKKDKNIIIAGSLALMMHGLLPLRSLKDVDLILPHYTDYTELFQTNIPKLQEEPDKLKYVQTYDEVITYGSDVQESLEINLNNTKQSKIKIDIFINPKLKYKTVTFLGKEYKVSEAYPIIDAKLKYSFQSRNQSTKNKHTKDLIHVLISELKKDSNSQKPLKDLIKELIK